MNKKIPKSGCRVALTSSLRDCYNIPNHINNNMMNTEDIHEKISPSYQG